MTIYLMRHGQAGRATSDSERELTEEGTRATAVVAERARRAGMAPAAVLSSTYTRAVQTAEIAARALGFKGRIERTAALLPDCPPFDAWDDICARHPEGDLLVVAHEPLLSALAALLLDSPSLQVQMTPAAMVAIEIERLAPQPSGVLRWMLTPQLA